MIRRFASLIAILGVTLLLPACQGLQQAEGESPYTEAKELEGAAKAGSESASVAADDDLKSEGRKVETGEIGGAARPEAKPAAASIFKGSGVLVRPREVKAEAVRMPSGDITLNFVNASVREVARVVLGDILEFNYAVDPQVEGTITVRTSQPLPRASLLPTLERVLQMNGVSIIRSEGLYKIVPLEKAPPQVERLSVGPRGPVRGIGFRVQVVPLQFISAAEMKKILEPLVPASALLTIDETRNLLIVGSSAPDLATLLETVEIFDVDWLTGMSFGMFTLEFAEPKTMVDELEKILAGGAAGNVAGTMRFIPIERLNTVLVISPQAGNLKHVQTWIKRLDRVGEGAGPGLYVYFVRNGKAVDLAATLNEVFSGAPRRDRGVNGEVAPGLAPAEIATEAIPGTAPSTEPGAAARPAPPAGRPAAGAVPSEVVAEFGLGEIRVIPDEANNALVISASPAGYRVVKATLEKLDIVPLQVMIEATIAEVTLRDELFYGIQWFLARGGFELTFSDVATGVVAPAFPGFSTLFKGFDARAVLDALTRVTDVNVVSSPQVMVLGNKTAMIQVGDQVPIPIRTVVTVEDPAAPTVNTIELLDTGVILRVTPRVNPGGLVIMEIEQEVSDAVATTTSTIDSPTIRQRKISSTVAVQSGETVALGGLIREIQTESHSGIPILSDIPIVGGLFGTTSDELRRTELLVLITPSVIESSKDARRITRELRQRMRAVIPLGRKIQ